ncbi:MAG: PstA family ABC transporter permease [Akkermansiaceae bacterium]
MSDSSNSTQSSGNPFASKKSSLRTKEKVYFSGYAFATYFIILCASFIFGKIIINGVPVLMDKGFSFVTQKPQTLAALEVEKGTYEVPTTNFDNMLISNPDDLPLSNEEVFDKSFDFVSFQIENGSLIGDGYLKDIEKDNKGYYLKFTERKFPELTGFSLDRDKAFTLKKPELDIIQQHDPQLIAEVKTREINLPRKKVTVKAGEYPLSKSAHDALIPTDFVFQMKQSFPDDEPNKINATIIPEDQTFTVDSSVYNTVFDEDEPGTLRAENVIPVPNTIIFADFTLPKGDYKVSEETLEVLSNYGIKHMHNTNLGAIVVNTDDDETLSLSKQQFDQLIIDNPELKVTNVENTQQKVAYTKFNLDKDSEIQLNISDYQIFKEEDKSFTPTSEKTNSYSGGGILGPIIGTACLVIICMVIALFTGIAAATYLNEYARKGGFTKAVRLAMLNLAGVPSIVFGLFGLGLFVMLAPVLSNTPNVESELYVPIVKIGSAPDLRYLETEGVTVVDSSLSTANAVESANIAGGKKFYNGWYYISFQGWGTCMLAGGFTLAIMVLPVIITSCEESLKAVPMGFREAAMALGATKWQAIRTAVLPYAFPGILTASVLGITRVAGETAPIMFTAAAAEKSDLPWQGIHSSGFSVFIDFLQQSVQALPYHIFTVAGRIPQSEYTQPMQYGSVLVFMMIVFSLSAVSIYLRIRIRNRIKW